MRELLQSWDNSRIQLTIILTKGSSESLCYTPLIVTGAAPKQLLYIQNAYFLFVVFSGRIFSPNHYLFTILNHKQLIIRLDQMLWMVVSLIILKILKCYTNVCHASTQSFRNLYTLYNEIPASLTPIVRIGSQYVSYN